MTSESEFHFKTLSFDKNPSDSRLRCSWRDTLPIKVTHTHTNTHNSTQCHKSIKLSVTQQRSPQNSHAISGAVKNTSDRLLHLISLPSLFLLGQGTHLTLLILNRLSVSSNTTSPTDLIKHCTY